MIEAGLVISHLLTEPSRGGRRLAEAAGRWSLRRKRPDWLAGLDRRLSFHWDRGPVEADFQSAFHREGLDRLLAETPVDLFSFDLGPAARRRVGFLPLGQPLGPAALRRRTEAALKFIRRHYQGPLAAENYNHYPTGLYGPVTRPDFIRAYLEEFGLGLALDVAHAQVTAFNLNLDPAAYLEELPLELTAEVHLSRPWLPPLGRGLWAVDAHDCPGPVEWQLFKNIIKTGRLPISVPVFLEYYGNLSKLIQAQSRLKEILIGN